MTFFSCGGGVSIWQNKNPTGGWQWGSVNLVNESEPDCRATQQQHIRQQQIQVATHARNIAGGSTRVKLIFLIEVGRHGWLMKPPRREILWS
jgi:hypothetical protein